MEIEHRAMQLAYDRPLSERILRNILERTPIGLDARAAYVFSIQSIRSFTAPYYSTLYQLRSDYRRVHVIYWD